MKHSTITENPSEILRQFRGKALWTALATLFDGEGCIGLAWESTKGEKFNAHLTVAGTCREWIAAWSERLGKGNVYFYDSRTPNQKPTAFWKITKRADIVYILKKIQPYLIVKREQAHLLISFFEDKLSANQTWLGAQELERRRGIYNRIRDLNKKGPSESRETIRRTEQSDDIVRPSEPSEELDDNVLVQ